MILEIKIATNFMLTYLYDKLPRRRVTLFGEELEKYLKCKLNLSNLLPISETDQQLLTIEIKKNEYIDPCLVVAAKESAMDLNEVLDCLPEYLKIFIVNGQVVYKDTNQEQNGTNELKCLFKQQQTQSSPDSFNESLSSSASSSSSCSFSSSSSSSSSPYSLKQNSSPSALSPSLSDSDKFTIGQSSSSTISSPSALSTESSASSGSFLSPSFGNLSSFGLFGQSDDACEILPKNSNSISSSNPTKTANNKQSVFTTAAFAQTKFGSTKSKSYVKPKPLTSSASQSASSSKHLSSDFGAFIKQKVSRPQNVLSNASTFGNSMHNFQQYQSFGLNENSESFCSSPHPSLDRCLSSPNSASLSDINCYNNNQGNHEPRNDLLESFLRQASNRQYSPLMPNEISNQMEKNAAYKHNFDFLLRNSIQHRQQQLTNNRLFNANSMQINRYEARDFQDDEFFSPNQNTEKQSQLISIDVLKDVMKDDAQFSSDAQNLFGKLDSLSLLNLSRSNSNQTLQKNESANSKAFL
jgi:hypothetical protein